RGAMTATVRPLGFCPLPSMRPLDASGDSEETTTVHYRPPGSDELKALRFPWAVATGMGESAGIPSSAFSVSAPFRATAMINGVLNHRDDLREQHRIEVGLGPTPFLVQPGTRNDTQAADLTRISKIPSAFAFQYSDGAAGSGLPSPDSLRDESRPNAKFGY